MLILILGTNSSNQTSILTGRVSISIMDTLITFVDLKGFLKNPPSLAPHPDFTLLRALHQHMIDVLRQLSCPQSAIQGWAGLVMHPTMYAMIKMVPFQVPRDPGNVPTLPAFAMPASIKITERLFKRDKTYFTSYKNIYRECYKMLNNNIANKFKMSPDPRLIGWNSTMRYRISSTNSSLCMDAQLVTSFSRMFLFSAGRSITPRPPNACPGVSSSAKRYRLLRITRTLRCS
jgi:hypothetical protein